MGGQITTLTVSTPRTPGKHVYFVGARSNADIVKGLVNARSTGGYTLLPPSHTSSKVNPQYADGDYVLAVASPPVPLPDWLKVRRIEPTVTAAPDSLDKPTDIGRAITHLKGLGPVVMFHGADDATYKAACVLYDFGISEETAVELMREHFDLQPQMPDTDDFLTRLIHNGYHYAGNEHPGSKAVGSGGRPPGQGGTARG